MSTDIDLSLGDTQLILKYCRAQDLSSNKIAYVLATAYWESGRTMEPVEEAYWLSDARRKKYLTSKKYYPWYGRGYVQCTWERNYRKVCDKLGIDFNPDNPNVLTDPEIAAEALVRGCNEGWYTGKSLGDYLTDTRSDYVGARRVVNGTDKARAIAELARDYEEALRARGYVNGKPAPIANEMRSGKPARGHAAQSKTQQATIAAATTAVLGNTEAAQKAVGDWSTLIGVSPQFLVSAAVVCLLGYVAWSRYVKWQDGVR